MCNKNDEINERKQFISWRHKQSISVNDKTEIKKLYFVFRLMGYNPKEKMMITTKSLRTLRFTKNFS